MAQESFMTFNDIIDKCHFTFKKDINADKIFLKEITLLQFKITAIEPITIECDSFPTKEQFLKLTEVIQKAVERKAISGVGKIKKYSAENSRSNDPALLPVDSEPNEKLIQDSKDVSELADKISKVHISPVVKNEKNNSSSGKIRSSSIEDIKKKENKTKANNIETTSKSETGINIRNHILSPTKFSVESLHCETNTESTEAQIRSKTSHMIKKANSVPEKDLKRSQSLEGSECSTSSENEQLISENKLKESQQYESIEYNTSKPKECKSASKKQTSDRQRINKSSSSDEEDSSSLETTKLDMPEENKTQSSKGKELLKSTTNNTNLEKIETMAQNSRSEASKQSLEKQKLSIKKCDDQRSNSDETYGESKKIKKSKHEPMDVSDNSDSETKASASKFNAANKYEDSPSSFVDNNDSDTEVETSCLIDESNFKAAELYFKDTGKSSIFKDAKKIKNKYEVIVSTADRETRGFLKQIKDFKMFSLDVEENADHIANVLKSTFSNLKIYFDQTIIYVTGPQHEVLSAKSKVLTLMGNKDDQILWSSTKPEKCISEDFSSKSCFEKGTAVRKMNEKQQNDSSRDNSKINILPVLPLPIPKIRASENPSYQGGARPKESHIDLGRTERGASSTKYEAKHENPRGKPMSTKSYYEHCGESGVMETLDKSNRHIDWQNAKNPVFIGNIKIVICNEDITKLSIDCIVNAAYKNLKHQYGAAKCIAKAAGERLERECDQYVDKYGVVEVTNVVVTTAGNLNARKVIHAVGPLWEDFNKSEKFQSDLRKTVLRCLIEASKLNMSSIALPSISYSIKKVPKEKCAESYFNAVKSFDSLMKELQLSSLKEIHFVDLNVEMSHSISQCFIQHWENDIDSQSYKEDLIFAKRISEKRSGSYHAVHRSNSRSRTAVPKPSGTKKEYDIGRAKVVISAKPAMGFKCDQVVVIGDLFDALSDLSYFDVNKLKKTNRGNQTNKPEQYISKPAGKPEKEIYKFTLSSIASIDESLREAFRCVKEIFPTTSKSMVSIIITSKILYPEKSILPKKNYPNQNHVKSFSRFLYKYIEEIAEGHIQKTVIIAASEDAIPTIIKVIDGEEDQKVKATQGIGTSVSLDEECQICTFSSRQMKLMKCCKKSVCFSCEKKLDRCPYCMKPYGILIGTQPAGRMHVEHKKFLDASGYEGFGIYEITYDIPSGYQTKDHPSPGQFYLSVKRTAFLPASSEGFYVLRLLRVAFLRRLIFTIGTSATSGKEDVITWNDIHHKTKLKSGSHSYPDENYLKNVQLELKSKGVTEDSFTEDEKEKLMLLSKKLNELGKYTDY